MTWGEFLIVFVCCAATILVFRVAPIFALKGRELPANAVRALNLIPSAAFAALIANDLIKPESFALSWASAVPFIATLLVLVVGYKTKSLVWCIVVGCGSYALMTYLPALF